MNGNSVVFPPDDCSCIEGEILIEESWINRFLTEQQMIVPVNDKTHLVHLKINLDSEVIHLQADIQEKE